MKKLFSVIPLIVALSIVSVKAVDDVITITNATLTSCITGKFHLTSLEVVNNNAYTVTAKFYDAPSTNITWASGQYTNWTTYTTNIVVTHTNYNGVVETSTNLAVYTSPATVATNLINYKLIKTMIVGTNSSATWQPLSGVYLSWGLLCTNAPSNIVVNVTYSNTQ